jgi:transposase
MNKEYIGVDLHSTQVTVHRIIVDEDGMVERKNGQYTIERMETHFIASLRPGCAVCVEAGSGSHTLARMIVAAGARAFVVNPLSLSQIFKTAKKTDRVDAKKLADCLKRHLESKDPEDGFPEVTVADEDTQRLRMLISQYQRVNADMTALKNNLYALFRQWLVQVDKGFVIERLDRALEHPRLPPEVGVIARREKLRYAELESFKAELRSMIETIGVVRYREQISLLIGVSGISIFGAACIMADIISIDRFRTSKNLTSYLRAAPRVDASNTTVHIGRLNKAGRRMAFEILLQSVTHLVGGNPNLLRYTKHAVGKSKNKVRAAVVGRSIRQIFYILKNKQPNRFLNEETFLVKNRRFEKILESQKSA